MFLDLVQIIFFYLETQLLERFSRSRALNPMINQKLEIFRNLKQNLIMEEENETGEDLSLQCNSTIGDRQLAQTAHLRAAYGFSCSPAARHLPCLSHPQPAVPLRPPVRGGLPVPHGPHRALRLETPACPGRQPGRADRAAGATQQLAAEAAAGSPPPPPLLCSIVVSGAESGQQPGRLGRARPIRTFERQERLSAEPREGSIATRPLARREYSKLPR